MTELFQQLLDWVQLHPLWSGALLFSVAMAESLALVGMIVPGVAIMFGIGALIAAGAIDFGTAMAWAVAGAVAGDGLSFWFGRHYRDRLRAVWPFTRYPQSLARGIEFFEKYGGKSVAIGRFFGPVRAVIPLVAGMMGMSPGRFAVANVLSALAWAPAYLLPGVVFGSSLKLASEVALRLVIVLLLLVALGWFAYWIIHRTFSYLQPRAGRLLNLALQWGERHPLVRSTAEALIDPQHPEARGVSILATVLLLMALLFALVTGWTLADPGASSGINETVLNTLQSLRSPWGDHLFVSITALADAKSLALLVSMVLAWLLLMRQRRAALYWLVATGFALLAAPLIKLVLRIPRPLLAPATGDSFAFPSGHTLWATIAFGFLAVLIARGLDPRWRWLPYSLAGMLVSGVALSRLYLGMHWLADVLASIALGVAWLAGLGIAYSRHVAPSPRPRPLALLTLALLLCATLIHLKFDHDENVALYAPPRQTIAIPEAEWWSGGWRGLPALRQDTRGRLEHPLRLQFAGSLTRLAAGLRHAGWQPAPAFDWQAAIRLFSPALPLSQLPLLPQVHAGRHETLSLVRLLPPDRRLVLRFWPADRHLAEDGAPLWVGVVNEQLKSELLNLLAYATSRIDSAQAFEQLRADLPASMKQRLTANGTLLLHLPAPSE
ncbi:MAG: VTT domain-containing protein [Gammaproteobacteria bacterium]|nr:VTT domain-containing protein [Gammaproteobacteria bacterium]